MACITGGMDGISHRGCRHRLHDAADLFADPLAGLAEEDHLLDVPADERLQGLEVPVLVAAAQQQDDGRLGRLSRALTTALTFVPFESS